MNTNSDLAARECDTKIERLFNEWDKVDEEGSLSDRRSPQVLRDGPVESVVYWSENTRLLFLLKEANDPVETKDKHTKQIVIRRSGNDWLLPGLRLGGVDSRGIPWDYWEVVARWSKGILDKSNDVNSWPSLEKEIPSAPHLRARELKRVAIVNIKKEGGGGSANHDLIAAYFSRTKELLKSQLEICSPHFIICGGSSVYEIMRKEIFETSQEKCIESYEDGARYFKWTRPSGDYSIVVNWFHYGYFPRLTPALKPWAHYGLVNAVLGIQKRFRPTP